MDFIDKPLVSTINLNRKPDELRIGYTYFFERMSNGEVIPMDDGNSAWDTYRRNRDFKYLGRTDGKLMVKAVQEAQAIFKSEGLEKAQERIRQGQQEEMDRCQEDKTPPNPRDVFGNGANHVKDISKYGR